MGHTIGIDLGTTNSCVAVMQGQQPVVIPHTEGGFTLPSVVAFTGNHERIVGPQAKRQAITNAARTCFCVKRLMGRRFDDPSIQADKEMLPYAIVPSARGDAWVQIEDTVYSPEELSSFILAALKSAAEQHLQEPVTDAVITVPAYFNDGQRQATRDAARLAGLEVQRIINEPTSAALAYGLEREDPKAEKRIVVFDLGGGTFDVSLLHLTDGVYQVVATSGDTHLGGADFDQVIVEHLCAHFFEQHHIDVKKDSMALQRVRDAAEQAKHALSTQTQTDIHLPFLATDAQGPKHLQTTLTRTTFEQLASELIERTLAPCQQALTDAKWELAQIDEVLCVGGMTRMPRIQARMAEFFGKTPNAKINPDEVVAQGAAIQGAVLQGEMDNILLLDVTSLSLGVETAGGVFTCLIPRNTTIPCSQKQIFSTAEDNQSLVNIHVVQGERTMASDNETLARFALTDILPAPRAVPQIEVTFAVDTDGRVHVRAQDLQTKKEQAVVIAARKGLREEEIQHLLDVAEQKRAEDQLRQQLAELRNNAEGLIYSTERSLQAYKPLLDLEQQEKISQHVALLQQAIAQDSVEKLADAYTTLEQIAQSISTQILADSPSTN